MSSQPSFSQEDAITVRTLRERRDADERIAALAVYDYPTARLADESGVDVLLVGDSVANVVLGHETTLAVTLDEMLVFARAVRRGARRALIVGDLPFGSYHLSVEDAVRSAIRYVKEGGVAAVKLEGGRKRAPLVQRIIECDIPVMGHIGLTPQSVNTFGGYQVQGKTTEAANHLIEDALAIEKAGAFALVLEGIPGDLARIITEKVKIPTIGIGAGVHCSGQILVLADLIGLTPGETPRFVRRYAEVGATIRQAIERYVADVRAGEFPSDAETYSLPSDVAVKLRKSGMGFVS